MVFSSLAVAAACGTAGIVTVVVAAMASRRRRSLTERRERELRRLVTDLRQASIAQSPVRRQLTASYARLIKLRAERWNIALATVGTSERELDRRVRRAKDEPRRFRTAAPRTPSLVRPESDPGEEAAIPAAAPIGEQVFDLPADDGETIEIVVIDDVDGSALNEEAPPPNGPEHEIVLVPENAADDDLFIPEEDGPVVATAEHSFRGTDDGRSERSEFARLIDVWCDELTTDDATP